MNVCDNADDRGDRATYRSWDGLSARQARSQTMALTKVSGKQSLPPSFYLRNPLIKREQSWYPTKHRNAQEKDDKPPWGDAQCRAIESLEVQPRADVDEACTVEHEIDHGSERFRLGLLVEPSVPGYRRACEVRRCQSKGLVKITLAHLQRMRRAGHPSQGNSRLR